MKTVISVKVDKDVRDRARKAAKAMGLPLSTVINRQLREFAEVQRIEFSTPLVPNARTRVLIDEAVRDWQEGHAEKFSPAFTNADDAVLWLNSKR